MLTVTPKEDRSAVDRAALRALITTLLDESGLIKPSVLAGADQIDAPAIIVEGFDLDANGKAPTEFRIFKAGANESTKGTFVFDDEAAASVMAIYAERKLDLMMDFEHMSLVKPPIIAPASCKRFVPQIRNGELWATECQWTNRARTMLEEGEIRYFSPAFDFDPETGRVLRLINNALTNNPALNAITPLVAATATATATDPPEEKKPMAFKKMKCSTTGCSTLTQLKGVDGDEETCTAADKEEAFCSTCRASAVLSGVGQKVMTALSLSADIGETAALSAVGALTKLPTELASLTGQATQAGQLGAIAGWKAKAQEADGLRLQLAALADANLGAELGTLLDSASSGTNPRLAPAQREVMKAKACDASGKPTVEGVKFVREFLSASGPVIQTAPIVPPAGGVALTEEEAKIARLLGRSPEQAAKDKAEALGAVVGR